MTHPEPPQYAAESTPTRQLPWAEIIWFGLLLGLSYAPVLAKFVKDWSVDEDMGHGFFVPAVSAYVIWQRREQLLSRSYQPAFAGWALLALGALMLMAGTLGAELFMTRIGFLVALVGLVAARGGVALVRELAFPLILLLFMVPLPAIIYTQITFPLQLLASDLAERTLTLVGIPVLRDGNVLELPSQKLQVVEACSGIRSLLSLSFLSLVYAYFFDEKRWMRLALFVCIVPIAIAANAARVTITGLLSERDPALAQGLYHSLEGWVIFMVSLVFLVVTHQLINRTYRAFHGKP